MTDDRAEKITARFNAMLTSEASTLLLIKDAALFVLQRDGTADWARIEQRLVEIGDAAVGETGAARSAAAIDHLRKLQVERG